MLKRQRASSPFPSSPSVPQDTPAEDVIDIRDLKRRRVAPPSLDGQTRGWNISTPNCAEDENEEEYAESDGQDGRNEAQLAQQPSNAEYAAVNSVLKEIHILQKHRHIFSLPINPQNAVHGFPLPSVANKSRIIYPPKVQTSSEESARVYEHYEGTNRLDSIFLQFLTPLLNMYSTDL